MMVRFVLLLLVAGCGHSIAALDRSAPLGSPRDDLPPLEEVPVHGFMVSVDYVEGDDERSLDGELLSIDGETLWILTGEEDVYIARSAVKEVEIELHPSGAGWIAGWMAGGALLTLSHGFFLLFSAPLWLLTGVPSTIASALNNDLTVPLDQLDALARFARFPSAVDASLERAPGSVPKTSGVAEGRGPPEILALLSGQKSELDRCANRSVRIRLAIEVAVTGRISTIEISESSGNRGTDGCVLRVLKTLRYPGPAKHDLLILLPWE